MLAVLDVPFERNPWAQTWSISMNTRTLATVALLALAACGGGSDADDELSTAADRIADLEGQIEEIQADQDDELSIAEERIAELELQIEEMQAETTPDTEAPTTVAPTTAAPTTAAPTTAAPTTAAPTTEAPGPSLTPSQQQAVRSAESYLDFTAFSRLGLIDQLSSEFGGQFPLDDATVAVDSLTIDWNEQAAQSAQSYLDFTGFSCQGLIDQLSSEFGGQFSVEQATYGATQAGIC